MDIQTITVVIAGVSVVIGVINSILSSRRAAQSDQLMLETRQAQLFAQISSWWRTRDAVKAYGNVRLHHYDKMQEVGFEEFMTKYTIPDMETYADQMTLNTFFEGIGVLVKKGLIDIEFVEDLLSQRIIWYWEHFMVPHIDYIRKNTNDPTQYDSIEYLYNVMKQQVAEKP